MDSPSKKTNSVNYILAFASIAISGFAPYTRSKILLTLFTLLAFLFFKLRYRKFDNYAIIYFILVILIYFAQSLIFNFFSFMSLGGLLLIILSPYLLIKAIGYDYLRIYVNIIYFFSIISYFFYIPSILSGSFHSFISKLPAILKTDPDNLQSIIIYNWEPYSSGLLRNAGPFWEPGAFAGFLIIAIIFNIILTKKIINRKNTVFIISVLTTLSTGAYFALVLLIFLALLLNKKIIYKLIFTPLIILLSTYAYFNLEFLGNKVTKNIEVASDVNNLAEGRGRFTSAVIDMEDLMRFPLTGRGRNSATRYDKQGDDYLMENHRTNGITDYAVRYGIIGFICYFFMMHLSFKKLCIYNNINASFSYVALIAIMTIGFSQCFFQQATFISLIYLFFLFKNNPA